MTTTPLQNCECEECSCSNYGTEEDSLGRPICIDCANGEHMDDDDD